MHPEFDDNFLALTGNPPFPWQRALFERFVSEDRSKRFPETCDLPTGLGKTSVMAIWLLALAHHARLEALLSFPRRLVYVVNRRTVVDQSTKEAEGLRDRLLSEAQLQAVADTLRGLRARVAAASESPLAISTLRGAFADNAEWRDDPARPAIIAGTVDMIGSRLLFSGYGRGFKSRPLHAAFLGQDVLLVHDEAHLEPAFQCLAEKVAAEIEVRDLQRFHVMELSATSRASESFSLSANDLRHPEVKKRIYAKKGLAFRPVSDDKKLADEVIALASRRELRDTGQAILVYLRRVEDVIKVAEKLAETFGRNNVRTLTGTLRGLERDDLATKSGVFARFVAKSEIAGQEGTVCLVCTSAGEVGVNISADHLVCDLSSFDSMAQRLGRVNRFGNGDALIDVVTVEWDAADEGSKKLSDLDQARRETLLLLRNLPVRDDGRRDACPAALRELPVDPGKVFAPPPKILPVSDILFDAWALTTIRGFLPGRPPVTDWLHGKSEWEPPDTRVAWRREVSWIEGDVLVREDLLEDYPLKPHELLRDRSGRVFAELKKLAARHPEQAVWLVDESGRIGQPKTLNELIEGGQELIERATVLLPPEVGGLSEGALAGSAVFDPKKRYDVADEWKGPDGVALRLRLGDDERPLQGTRMRLVRSLELRTSDDELDEEKPASVRDIEDGEPSEEPVVSKPNVWRWYVKPKFADDDGSRVALGQQDLVTHLESAESFAQAIAERLLVEPERTAIVLAAKWHDLGKARQAWQNSIGNFEPGRTLAKSGSSSKSNDRLFDIKYRHEFGSLLDLRAMDEFNHLEPALRELVLHLVAAHHGRARPHFPGDEAFDPERPESETHAVAREVPRRFARLQERYGRWGLAYLESLVRAADALASQAVEPADDPESTGAQEPIS